LVEKLKDKDLDPYHFFMYATKLNEVIDAVNELKEDHDLLDAVVAGIHNHCNDPNKPKDSSD